MRCEIVFLSQHSPKMVCENQLGCQQFVQNHHVRPQHRRSKTFFCYQNFGFRHLGYPLPTA